MLAVRRSANWANSKLPLVAWLFAFSLLTRIGALGDQSYSNDEAFYVLVGQLAHQGTIPYVDIWDRKGPGLFLLTFLVTALSPTMVSFRLAAWLCASATAVLISSASSKLFGRTGAWFAGTFYLALLPLYGGGGGQSPVFYNLLIALAGWLVLHERQQLQAGRVGWQIYAAMFCAGMAITFKQCAAPESAFLGCYCLWQLRRSGTELPKLIRAGFGLAFCGAAPMMIFALSYASQGHFAFFWSAIVDANLKRTYNPPLAMLTQGGLFFLSCSPALIVAAAGLFRRQEHDWQTRFLGGWLLAACCGIAIMPNFFEHYALPLFVPASIAAGGAISGGRIRPMTAMLLLVGLLAIGPALRFDLRAQSRVATQRIVTTIQSRDPHPRLLIFGGPVALYSMLDAKLPPSPLRFPMHLFHRYENNSGPFNTKAEVQRILAWKPTVVTLYSDMPSASQNPATTAMIRGYVAHCELWLRQPVRQVFATDEISVYGNCAK